MIRWLTVAGLLVFALAPGETGAAHAPAASYLDSAASASSASEETAAGGEDFPLALKVKIEQAWTGDGLRSNIELVNFGTFSLTDVAVRVCLPEGWTWGPDAGTATFPSPPLWKRAPEDPSSCRRFLLGAVPGRRKKELVVELVRWPPPVQSEEGPWAGVLDVAVLDVSVFGASRPGEPAKLALRRSFELTPGLWAQFGGASSGEREGEPSAVQSGLQGRQGLPGRPVGLAASVALAVESDVPGPGGGRAGARWNIAGDAGWGAVSAELRAARAWEDGFSSPAGPVPSLAWTSAEGAARIGSARSAVELDWRFGPAKVVSLGGVRPTLPAASAWSAAAWASGETVWGKLGVGRAAGDIWSCRMAEAAVGWKGDGAEAALSFTEVMNTSINTRGPQQKRAALAQLEAGSQSSLGGRTWSIRGALARGIPRTLTPSCGISPKEGWRLRLLAESAEPGLLERVSWAAAWPLEPSPGRPSTHEVAVALSLRMAPAASLNVEPALRLAAGGEAALALRTQAEVGPLHRFRVELGPEALTPASELPRAGEGAGRVLAGWNVPRGPVRPRLTYESERLPGGRQNELRGGLTLLGSLRIPWGGRTGRVEGSVRLAREHSWGVKGEKYENLLALRLGRRPSTVRAEWTWTEGEWQANFAVEHGPGNAAALERVWLALEQVSKGAGLFRRLEGAMEGRWALGRWGGALAYALSPAGARSARGSEEAEEAEGSSGTGDAAEIVHAASMGAFGGAAARAFVTWELDRWQLKGEWAESAHTEEPPGFARRVELEVKRRISEALSLAVEGGFCWSGSGPKPCPLKVVLGWRPPLGEGETVVALHVEFPPESARVGLSVSAPLTW